MFCAKCGATLRESSQFCDRCGAPTVVQPSLASAQVASPIEAGKTSGRGLGSLMTGIFALLVFPLAIVAIILGHISRSEIRKSNGSLQGARMALTGLIFGYAGIAFIPLILIIAAIAIPNLLRARIAANEASAVHSVRQIVSAEATYYLAYPNAGYTCTLSSLAGGERPSPSTAKMRLIDDHLAMGATYGYPFSSHNLVRPETGAGKYQVVAYPLARNRTGVRAFC